MSTTVAAPSARDVAKGHSMFEIDESLAALVEAAEECAAANNGEVPDELKTALATYAEAFGYKVDRIAEYLKAQKAEADLARGEAERLQARYKAAENREKRLKQMLAWFMVTRNVRQLRGELNTITLQSNSAPSLVVDEGARIPDSFYRAQIDLTWPEWSEILDALPPGPLRERLGNAKGKSVQKELQRGILSDAVARGEHISGAKLVKGSHIRLR
jgi:hypothetical protein